ncbi:hypothetical protein [Streptomyces geranii]|uniref:hypothetical protein n=1 Tax=Streptomyces geranii TaxID=2058923 RepID=UPI001300B757|nr:hypothetical protein [Streptomyces geranii]
MRYQDRRRKRSRVRVLAIVLAGLWCCGCSGNGTPAPTVSDPTVSDPGRNEISAADREKLHNAEQLLIQRCMKRYGFKTWPTSARSSLPDLVDFPYVVTDEKWASRHGYGSDIHESMFRLRQQDPNQIYFAKLPPEKRAAALTALNGAKPVGLEARMPTGGVLRRSDRSCVSEAESILYGDLRTWYRVNKVTESLSSLRIGNVLKDGRFREAIRPWASCMREHGYPYSTPEKARSAALLGADERGGRAEEIRTAIAEARCAAGTGLSETVRRLDSEHKAALEKEYSSEFGKRNTMESEALFRAADITA